MCDSLDVLLPVITKLVNTSEVIAPVVAAAVLVVKPLTAAAAEVVVKAAEAAVVAVKKSSSSSRSRRSDRRGKKTDLISIAECATDHPVPMWSIPSNYVNVWRELR